MRTCTLDLNPRLAQFRNFYDLKIPPFTLRNSKAIVPDLFLFF